MKEQDKQEKKTYAAPELKVHGTVADLTQNQGTLFSDGLTASVIE